MRYFSSHIFMFLILHIIIIHLYQILARILIKLLNVINTRIQFSYHIFIIFTKLARYKSYDFLIWKFKCLYGNTLRHKCEKQNFAKGKLKLTCIFMIWQSIWYRVDVTPSDVALATLDVSSTINYQWIIFFWYLIWNQYFMVIDTVINTIINNFGFILIFFIGINSKSTLKTCWKLKDD